MFASSSFWQTQDILTKAMDAYTVRWQVISDNIANANTPNFKRSDVSFESELQRALNNPDKPHLEARRTDPRHRVFYDQKDWRSVQPTINLDYQTEMRNDKNNVDIDKEIVYSAKTQLQYNAAATIMTRQFRLLNMVVK